ncbi:MAG: hypothetical protein OHK0029_13190 [Armatimonadaceae bacterium]
MIRHLLAASIAVSALALSTGQALAQPTAFSAIINGAQEVPPRDTPGSGFGTILILNANTIQVNLSVSNLLTQTSGGDPSAITVGHIHQGAPGTNGGVVVDLFAGFTGTGGPGSNFVVINQTYTGTGVANFVTGAQSGLQYYFNIHSNAFPGGEVRGNLVAAPEPGTLGLLALGSVAFGVVARRRMRR